MKPTRHHTCAIKPGAGTARPGGFLVLGRLLLLISP